MHGLNISPATILDLTRRAADAVQSQYDAILNRIRDAQILYVDETSIDVQGELQWTMKEYVSEKVRKLIGKINNGFEYWFTFVIHPSVEPTNNRAERALREHVVLRKILGTLRNGKGTSIHERIMTVLATWEQQGLNSLQMLRTSLSS
ncbi:Transposase IS66 family protein [uncultured archaeon]|nr:Transposase IS66 family protein [uncultured archaeon]